MVEVEEEVWELGNGTAWWEGYGGTFRCWVGSIKVEYRRYYVLRFPFGCKRRGYSKA